MTMIRHVLILAILPVAFGAQAACVLDAAEMGDIGPDSAIVCGELERLYPGATLAVENRTIHSPTEVSVVAAVDGAPISLRYHLSGYRWRLDAAGTPISYVPRPHTNPAAGN
jgi:hypothetical protein